jgi:hypothetical protein
MISTQTVLPGFSIAVDELLAWSRRKPWG